jgi:hypothetical protein
LRFEGGTWKGSSAVLRTRRRRSLISRYEPRIVAEIGVFGHSMHWIMYSPLHGALVVLLMPGMLQRPSPQRAFTVVSRSPERKLTTREVSLPVAQPSTRRLISFASGLPDAGVVEALGASSGATVGVAGVDAREGLREAREAPEAREVPEAREAREVPEAREAREVPEAPEAWEAARDEAREGWEAEELHEEGRRWRAGAGEELAERRGPSSSSSLSRSTREFFTKPGSEPRPESEPKSARTRIGTGAELWLAWNVVLSWKGGGTWKEGTWKEGNGLGVFQMPSAPGHVSSKFPSHHPGNRGSVSVSEFTGFTWGRRSRVTSWWEGGATQNALGMESESWKEPGDSGMWTGEAGETWWSI